MKRLYIIVVGQSEQEFVREQIAPYLSQFGIFSVTPILIRTSSTGKGGFVNYAHLRNDIKKLLASSKHDFIVSMLVDFFRCPDLPNKENYEEIANHRQRVNVMEQCIANDINDKRFMPYIQLYEFETLLYASDEGFEVCFNGKQCDKVKAIIAEYDNPEDINTTPQGAPSKRLLA